MFAEKLGIELSFADFERGWNSIYTGLIPETVALLAELSAKIRLYAFTNSNSLHRKVWTGAVPGALDAL